VRRLHPAGDGQYLRPTTGRFYGVQMKASYICTIAGPFPGAHSVAVDGHGNIEVLDTVESVVRLVAVRSGTFTASR
jgi:hypothetical protein